MSARGQYVVWVWRYGDGRPAYVGYGSAHKNNPATVIWENRFNVNSPLTKWLRSLTVEPSKSVVGGGFSRSEAASIAQAYRNRLKDQGVRLFDSRPYGTKLGGGKQRGIMGPDFTVYGSVRQAAAAIGVNPSTITRRCQQKGTDGWDYVDIPEN